MASVVEFDAGRGDWARRVRFASDDIELHPNAATQIAVGLLPAMRYGMELAVEGSIDPRLHAALDTIQDIQAAWVPNLRRVDVRCTVAESPAGAGSRVGCFFTGGVDSFYTLLKHHEDVTDLVFVHGYDVRLDDLALRKRVSATVRKVATTLGKGVVEIETDLRGFLDPNVEWGATHGAALAAVGHLLVGDFRRFYLASSYGYAELFPWGSHPLLDPLWSHETLEFVHDGCDATRLDKVRFLAGHDLALQHLRVCYENPNGASNCGHCRKCLLTMCNLVAVGALSRCPTFPEPLDPERVKSAQLASESTRVLWRQNLHALERSNPDLPLVKAIRHALRRATRGARWRYLLRAVRRRLLRAPSNA